jgi:ATP-binding cassette, subfamily F, member 1
VDFKYPGRDDFGLKNVSLGIDMGDRLVIVGPNGAGKTTFMNLMSGDLIPTAGDSRRSQKLRIGRYSQVGRYERCLRVGGGGDCCFCIELGL